jgi:rod shape-determining protein MreC
MEKFFKSMRFKILMTVIAILFGIMLYSASRDGIASMPEKLLSYVTVPFQKVASSISDGVTNFLSKYVNADAIAEENKELQAEVDQLRKDLIDFEDYKKENEELKNYLDIKDQHPDFQFQSASIIARDPENKYETFTIDQGYLNGVSRLDPVITDSGLVGIVERVGPLYSVVCTILSPQINGVAAYDVNQPEQMGIVVGDIKLAESNLCKMELLEEELTEGDLIVTSGSSGIFPKDLVIGTVKQVRMESTGTSYYAQIIPANDILKLQEVVVITDFLGQGAGDEEQSEE